MGVFDPKENHRNLNFSKFGWEGDRLAPKRFENLASLHHLLTDFAKFFETTSDIGGATGPKTQKFGFSLLNRENSIFLLTFLGQADKILVSSSMS